jgi:ankyrin repeat protein
MNRIEQELIDAVGENNVPEVRRLMSVGADVNTRDSDQGLTPLLEASGLGHVQVVNDLLEHGADIQAQTTSGSTPLHWACIGGHLAVVNELLSPNDSSNGATTSLLGKRGRRGGADTEAKDNIGDTPLHDASRNGHMAIVKALLSGGANILATDHDGMPPIHQAVTFGNSEVAKYLLQQFYATTRCLPLHELLKDLTWIGNPFSSGAPPLRFAIHQNVLSADDVVEILEYLVGQNPALLSSRDQDGSLPLHVACRRGAAFTIVQSLVNLYKASVKSVTPQGDLPLFLACEMPETSLDTIFLLIKLYPDLVYR